MVRKSILNLLITIVYMLLVTNSAWAMICSDDGDVLIPDDSSNTGPSDANPGSPGSITIDVPPGAVGTITDLDFQLEIDIAFPGDLIVTLTSPSGTSVVLINRPGRADDGSGTGGFGCGNPDIDATLDDSSGSAAEDECNGASPAISGTLSPTGNLSDFNGEPLSGTWTLTAVDFFPLDQGTFIGASTCLSATTTPVTVSSVKTRQRGNRLIFDWQTNTEAFNLGFHLWGMVNGQWQQLNNRLIAAEVGDSLTPTDYKKRINLTNLDGEVTAVGLSALSTSGQEDFYGPFEIGESYGEQSLTEKIDWIEQRKVYDQARLDAGYSRINNRWVLNTEKRQRRNQRQSDRYQDVVLSIIERGVYRVSHEGLLSQGIDLTGMRIKKMALTRDGVAVPRIVNTVNDSKRFGAGSEIIFYAQGPSQDSIRYVDNARYVISLNTEKVLNVDNPIRELIASSSVSDINKQTVSFGENNAYLFALPGNSPWYDTSIRAFGQVVSQLIDVTIPSDALLDHPAEIELSVVGGLEFDLIDADGDGELEPNHHYKVYLNRASFPEAIYEGYSNSLDPVDIKVKSNGQLHHGDNVIELELIPDNGYNIDAAFYLGGSLSYMQPNTFDSTVLSFVVDGSQPVIELKDQTKSLKSAYSFDGEGNFSEIGFTRISKDVVRLNSPSNPSLSSEPSLWLASDLGYLTVNEIFRLEQPEDESLSLDDVDYVVIADPSLIGEDLERFSDQQSTLGRKVKIVKSDDIYAKYADGLAVPQAISEYLSEAAVTSPFQYVLLVGGHTYNYRGYNLSDGQELVNMIPSFYHSADFLLKQIPTTVPFVDFDDDGFPDRAIGRWPVRDITQLKNVVDKTILWHAQGSNKDSKSSLFIADIQDDYNDFTSSSNRLISELGLPTDPWNQPITVYSDEIKSDSSVESGNRLAVARDALVDGINQGPALTIYSGHGAPVSWGSQRLLNSSIVERFDNSDAPTLIIPLACYTTYYETPEVESLSEQLFTASNKGAVALSGAGLLSATLDNENFTTRLLKLMTVSGLDLGTAVMKVKQSMKGGSSGQASLVYNWMTLGDPTLSFGLPDIASEMLDEAPNVERLLRR